MHVASWSRDSLPLVLMAFIINLMDRCSLTSKAHPEHLLNETEMTQYYLFTAEEEAFLDLWLHTGPVEQVRQAWHLLDQNFNI